MAHLTPDPFPALRPDLQAKAVELEHELFRNAKVATLYKASVLRKVGFGWRGREEGSPTALLSRLRVFLARPGEDWNSSTVQLPAATGHGTLGESLAWGCQELARCSRPAPGG